MSSNPNISLVRIYAIPVIVTLLIWIFAGVWGGWSALFTVIVLTLLETTFSADNAVVNSKVLVTLSPFWQKLFMTLGIFIAVFLVRFILPILIVMITASLGFMQVIDLALNHPHEYGEALEKAGPLISSFGGTFLVMIALSYFIDYEKKTHWLGFLERHLGRLGRFDHITIFTMLIATLVIFATVDAEYHVPVLVAAISAMILHIGLDMLDAFFSREAATKKSTVLKTGAAGFAGFMYLEVLDSSFSLDGVIGAFALTSSVVLIMAGLGAGAIWVRSITVHLVQAKALSKYIFLEHGAHWAIGFLGGIMLLKLYHIEPPEWFVGSLGLIFIVLAIWWSARKAKISTA